MKTITICILLVQWCSGKLLFGGTLPIPSPLLPLDVGLLDSSYGVYGNAKSSIRKVESQPHSFLDVQRKGLEFSFLCRLI